MDEQLTNVMAQVFNVSTNEITQDASIDNVEKWDSLTHANLIMSLEQEFNVSFDALEIVEMLNYKIIAMTIEEKLS
tara:strand:- start:293 stop:520 length:228 start_codon:yes stop_codon:yes gene_type:complete